MELEGIDVTNTIGNGAIAGAGAGAGADSGIDSNPNPNPNPNSVTETDARPSSPDAIEILVQMAKNGEIDAKAVDIIDVTDKFLKAIAAAPKENLRQSGKVLFHACVLLRMKADALLAPPMEEEAFGDDYMDFDENGLPIEYNPQVKEPRQITIQDLEKAIVRTSNRKKSTQTPGYPGRAHRRPERSRKNREDKSRENTQGSHRFSWSSGSK